MLPSNLAREIHDGIRRFLVSAYAAFEGCQRDAQCGADVAWSRSGGMNLSHCLYFDDRPLMVLKI